MTWRSSAATVFFIGGGGNYNSVGIAGDVFSGQYAPRPRRSPQGG